MAHVMALRTRQGLVAVLATVALVAGLLVAGLGVPPAGAFPGPATDLSFSGTVGGTALAGSNLSLSGPANATIFYTLDGAEPGPTSIPYLTPFILKASAVIKAGVFAGGTRLGPVSETKYFVHQALGRPVALKAAYSPKYEGGGPVALVDGLRGDKNHSGGRWQGFEGDDLAAVIDLGAVQTVRTVTIGFLEKIDSWIFFPTSVEIALSVDGSSYRPLPAPESPAAEPGAAVSVKDVRISAAGAKARYIRVTAVSRGTCPEGHPGAGQKAWLFADEIIVE